MRPLRMDELPQILHLITGTMSLVGPRPLLVEHLPEAGGGGRRHEVRPGFTCYAQLELARYGYLDRYRQVSLDDAGRAVRRMFRIRRTPTGLAADHSPAVPCRARRPARPG